MLAVVERGSSDGDSTSNRRRRRTAITAQFCREFRHVGPVVLGGFGHVAAKKVCPILCGSESATALTRCIPAAAQSMAIPADILPILPPSDGASAAGRAQRTVALPGLASAAARLLTQMGFLPDETLIPWGFVRRELVAKEAAESGSHVSPIPQLTPTPEGVAREKTGETGRDILPEWLTPDVYGSHLPIKRTAGWVRDECRARRIPGAKKVGREWVIPKSALDLTHTRLADATLTDGRNQTPGGTSGRGGASRPPSTRARAQSKRSGAPNKSAGRQPTSGASASTRHARW